MSIHVVPIIYMFYYFNVLLSFVVVPRSLVISSMVDKAVLIDRVRLMPGSGLVVCKVLDASKLMNSRTWNT